ncbi:MAG: ABC transporter ATP-binding protein/permease [Oceanicaulis sp.]|nr:ABC transporter ATP-binding protein/permease [Oceanicaulis sp.]
MFRFFETRVDPFPATEPEAPPKGLLGFVAYYTRPVWPWLITLSVLTAIISVFEVVFLGFLGTLVDWLAAADRETLFEEHGAGLIAMAAFVLIGFPLLVLLNSLITHQTIFGNFPMVARWLTHRYILGQSMSFFQDEFAGRVSQKVMQTALAVRETVMKVLDIFVYVVVYFIGALVLVGGAEPFLMVPLVVWLAAYIWLLLHFIPRLRDISMKQADARAEMTGRVVDSYTNIQTIKLFAHARREEGYARDAMSGFLGTVYKQMRLVTGLYTLLQTLNAVLLVAVTAATLVAWQMGLVGLGVVAVAVAIVMRIRAMSDWILWETASLFEAVGTIQDGINTIAQEQAIKDAPDATPLIVSKGAIRFESISFHYGKESGVIESLNLDIAPGEKVGLVGRSGVGKSTLVNLLLRFYELEAGRITIDGQDIALVTQDSLRQQIGMVTQDTSLLHRSIRDNIAYGSRDADEAAIMEAARRAQADAFIPALSDIDGRTGFDAHVGERGVKLSGGQRQRIAIARILLKNAPILVLDEATSALDSEIEAAIQGQLYQLMEGKTVIAIAHRLSTIAMLDRLVVMDKGRIIEQGSHDALLAKDGVYAQLWKRQSGGFLNVDAPDLTVAAK